MTSARLVSAILTLALAVHSVESYTPWRPAVDHPSTPGPKKPAEPATAPNPKNNQLDLSLPPGQKLHMRNYIEPIEMEPGDIGYQHKRGRGRSYELHHPHQPHDRHHPHQPNDPHEYQQGRANYPYMDSSSSITGDIHLPTNPFNKTNNTMPQVKIDFKPIISLNLSSDANSQIQNKTSNHRSITDIRLNKRTNHITSYKQPKPLIAVPATAIRRPTLVYRPAPAPYRSYEDQRPSFEDRHSSDYEPPGRPSMIPRHPYAYGYPPRRGPVQYVYLPADHVPYHPSYQYVIPSRNPRIHPRMYSRNPRVYAGSPRIYSRSPRIYSRSPRIYQDPAVQYIVPGYIPSRYDVMY